MHVEQTPFRAPAVRLLQPELGSASVHPPTQVTAAAEVLSRRIPLIRRTRTIFNGIILLRPARWLVQTALLAEVPVRRGTVPRPTPAPETINMVHQSRRLLPQGLVQAMPGGKVSDHLLPPRLMPMWETGHRRIRCPPSLETH